jgi:HEAT repeat protein
VVIKASSGRQIDGLVADLSSDRDVVREAAVARLTVIGTRAVDRLTALASDDRAPQAARAAAFRTLDAIGDPRAVPVAARAMRSPSAPVAAAAAAVLRGFLRGPHGAEALDALTAQALDPSRDPAVRVAALDALADLEAETRAPVWDALAGDPDAAVRAALERHDSVASSARVDLDAAADGELPDDPDALRHLLAGAPASTPLARFQQVIDRVRAREAMEPPPRRAQWATARAAAHLALAARNSRLALYDLREWLDAAEGPLPVDAVAALEKIGDASCLEPIAAAYARSTAAGRPAHDWWRQHLAAAFRSIVKRERITRRHAAVKKIEAKWAVLPELWPGRSRASRP